MNRRSLGVIAVILVVLMAIVATAGLDNLPRQLRQSVAAARTHFDSDRAAFDQNRASLDRAVRDEPGLFRARAAEWSGRLDKDRAALDSAAAELATLQQLAKANRRADADKVRAELSRFESMRQDPVRDSATLRTEAERWLTYKKELPQRVRSMRASYDALKAVDLDSSLAPVRKAMVDWPAKKDDLGNRLSELKSAQAEAEKIWDSTAPARAAAESGKVDGFDYGAFFAGGDRLDASAKQIQDGAASLNALAAQLYTSWDKVLVDAGDDRGSYREKFRTVRTRFADAALSKGQVSSDEKWQPVDRAEFKQAERALGMTVERKPAGKYDSEAERTVQPAAYAYVAPPGQSNQYGAWSGGVWHWLPQYLILSQLLHMSRPAITSGDFDAYQAARRRGEVFYGRNDEYRPHWGGSGSGWTWGKSGSSSPSSGTQSSGGWYKERPKSFGDGGFSGSKYKSKGTFGGSRFGSKGSFGSRGFGGAARALGRGGRR